MKKLLTILCILSFGFGYGQAFDFATRGGAYKSMRVYDSVTVSNLINTKLNISDSSTLYYSLFRSDSSRANLYSAIAAKGSGTLTSVSGTANRITSTGGNTPVIDISSTFEGLLLKKSDSTIYYTKFRSDTSRSNIYSAITGVGSTLYSGDGSLVGNRIVNMNGKTLSFQHSSTDLFKIDPAHGIDLFSQSQSSSLGLTTAFGVEEATLASVGASLILNGNSTSATLAASFISINNAYSIPVADGSANQVLTTDGSGTASWQDASGGVASVAGDLVDNTDPANPVVGLTGTHTLMGGGTVDLATNSLTFSDAGMFLGLSSTSINGQTVGGKFFGLDDGDDIVLFKYDNSNKFDIRSTGMAITGNVTLNTVPSGATTDSILTRDAATGIVNMRVASSFASADSSVWQTKYRSDSARANLYTSLAGKQASGNYAIADSSVWQTKYRSDSARTNLYTSLAGKQASGNYAIADSSVWQTKYRSDSARTNIYTSLAAKQATISVTSPITLTGASVGMVNQGTTTTVLHGNASGNPSFGAIVNGDITNSTIDLTAKVTGVLPVANGGTNASSASITSFNNITGYSAAGATGTTSTNLVFSTSPTLVTPTLGAALATSINGNIFTTGTYTLTGTAAKTLTFSNTLTLAGTDATTLTFPDTTSSISRIPQSVTLGSDDTTTLTVIQGAAGLTVWGRANKTYRVTAILLVSCDNTGGISVGIGGPAGSAVVSGMVNGTGPTSSLTAQVQRLGSINNVVGTSYNRFNGTTGIIHITGKVTTAGTAGAIFINFKSATLGNKSTISTNSWIELEEVQ